MTIKLLPWIILFIPATAIAQNQTNPTQIEQNKTEEVKLYNLYHLSKYMGSHNLDEAQKNTAYAHLINFVGSEKLQTNLENNEHYIGNTQKFVDERIIKSKNYTDFIDFVVKGDSNGLKSKFGSLKPVFYPDEKKYFFKENLTKIDAINKYNLDSFNLIINILKSKKTEIEKIKVDTIESGDSSELDSIKSITITTLSAFNPNHFSKENLTLINNDKIKNEINKNIVEINNKIDEIKNKDREINEKINEIKNKIVEIKNKEKEKEKEINNLIEGFKATLDKNITDTDNLINDQTQLINQLNRNIKEYASILAKYYFSKEIFSSTEINYNNLQQTITDNKTSNELIATNTYIQSLQSQGTSSYKGFNESQLIDAMAIFLANRAKQETAIWFMDQLRAKITNPLVKDAFPETLKLISTLEDYKVPNFGTAWRYAISTDFVKMPQNIVTSDWLANIVQDKDQQKLQQIRECVLFADKLNRLMAENYNYRDIIQNLYLDTVTPQKNSINSHFINESLGLMYMLTNEMYSVDNTTSSPTYRLLTFEEINALSSTEWKYLLELIYIKYFSDKDRYPSINKHLCTLLDTYKKVEDLTLNTKQNLSIPISKILLGLSQFDKVRKDLKDADPKESKDLSKQNFYNTWKTLEQIVGNLDFSPLLSSLNVAEGQPNGDEVKLKQTITSNLTKSLAIYEHLQTRNFSSAVQETFDLVNTLFAEDIPTTEGDFKIKDFKENIKIGNEYLILDKKGNTIKVQLSDKVENKTEIDTKLPFIQIDNIQLFKNLVNNNTSVSNVLHLLKNFNKKNYEEVTKMAKKLNISSSQLINLLVHPENIKDLLEQNNTSKSEAQGSASFVINNDFFLKEHAKYNDQIIKLTSFFGDIISASSSEQMADVISSHALPPTSYKLKRRVSHSIDLNAYVGAFGAYNIPSSNSTFEKGFTGGITAPIGVTWTFAAGKKKQTNLGFSFNFIELGNIVNHYLMSSERYYKNVHFSEVFSPNINFLYAIPKTPFVAFIGTSFLPLKTVTIDNVNKNSGAFDVTMIKAGIKIDIPLVNLSTKQ